MPACAAAPRKRASRRKWLGERDDHLADRRGVVEDVAEAAAQARRVERAGAGQRALLADREQQLEVDRRALGVRRWRASASSTATAALLSAPRIPSLAFSQTPSTSTGSTGACSGTVSRWAHSSSERRRRPRRLRVPVAAAGRRASRLPQSEPVERPGVVLLDLDAQRAQLARSTRSAQRALAARRGSRSGTARRTCRSGSGARASPIARRRRAALTRGRARRGAAPAPCVGRRSPRSCRRSSVARLAGALERGGDEARGTAARGARGAT